MRRNKGLKRGRAPDGSLSRLRNRATSEGDNALLSVSELSERITMLREEIARLEAELQAKDSTKSAAEALFRRG